MIAQKLSWSLPVANAVVWSYTASARLLVNGVGLILLLVIGAVFVYLTGGTGNSYTHVLYVPVAVAAFLYGLPGGVLTGLAAGLLMGPAMPQAVASGEMQQVANWLTRLSFYLGAGVILGLGSHQLRRRRERLERAVGILERTHCATLKAFSSVVEVHDGPTGEHCERVARNARKLGLALALPPMELDRLYWAGILHDVGKVAVPSSIIGKQAALSEEEYDQVKKHASFGAALLRSISGSFEAIAAGVETHHERWDGSGYPHGLRGQEIPLFGRILAVVDVFEAMTGDRPYREAVTPEQALIELRAGAGSLFQPELVALYERLFWDGGILVSNGEALEKAVEPKLTGWLTLSDSDG